jgi:hypothetical protein
VLRYGIPQYRLPKVGVLEAEYGASPGSAERSAAAQARPRLHPRRSPVPGFDAVVIAIGCYDTNKLGIPNEDADRVIDRLEYLQTATLGLSIPPPRKAGDRHRRRLHVDGLHPDVDPPGARVTSCTGAT